MVSKRGSILFTLTLAFLLLAPGEPAIGRNIEHVAMGARRKIWRQEARKAMGIIQHPKTRELIVNLLLRGNIESNPGPEGDLMATRHRGWSSELNDWLWPCITASETTHSGRIKALLKAFDLTAPGGQLIARVVAKVEELTAEECVADYYGGNAPQGGFQNFHRWTCIRAELARLLPPPSALDPEKKLNGMKKNKTENLREFVGRFIMTANSYTDAQLDKQRAAHILYRKLPQDMQKALAVTKFQNCELKELEIRVGTYMNWTSVSSGPWRNQLGDYMDIDGVRMASAELGVESVAAGSAEEQLRYGFQGKRILDGNKILFQNIDGPKTLMIAWRKLVSTGEGYRREAARYLAGLDGGRDNQHAMEDVGGTDFGVPGPSDLTPMVVSRDQVEGTTAVGLEEEEDIFMDWLETATVSTGSVVDGEERESVLCGEMVAGRGFWSRLWRWFRAPVGLLWSWWCCLTSLGVAGVMMDDWRDAALVEDGGEIVWDLHDAVAATNSTVSTDGGKDPIVCRHVSKRQNSLHAPIWVGKKRYMALVDTGATHSFIQKSLLDKMTPRPSMEVCNRNVRYGNGEVEKLMGATRLEMAVGEQEGERFEITAYVLDGKGPSLILGFPFLENNGFLVDCRNRRLIRSEKEAVVCDRIQLSMAGAEQTFQARGTVVLAPGQRHAVTTGLISGSSPGVRIRAQARPELARRFGLSVLSAGVGKDGEIRLVMMNCGEKELAIFDGQNIASGEVWNSEDGSIPTLTQKN